MGQEDTDMGAQQEKNLHLVDSGKAVVSRLSGSVFSFMRSKNAPHSRVARGGLC
jgi:hypothetical protein